MLSVRALASIWAYGLALADGVAAWPWVGPDSLLQNRWPVSESVQWRQCPNGEPADERPDGPLVALITAPGAAPFRRINAHFVLYRDGTLIRTHLDVRRDKTRPIRAITQRRHQLGASEVQELLEAIAVEELHALPRTWYWTERASRAYRHPTPRGPRETELYVWVAGCRKRLIVPALDTWPGLILGNPVARETVTEWHASRSLRDTLIEPYDKIMAELPEVLRDAIRTLMEYQPAGGVALCRDTLSCYLDDSRLPHQESWLR